MKRASILLVAAASLVATLSALGGTALAKKRCVPKAGPLVPVLTFPCAGGTVHQGHNITFKVRDSNAKAHKYQPFLDLTKKKPKHGRLAENPGAGGIFHQLKAVKGHPSEWTYRAPSYNFPGWWLVTPGTYYVQIQQIDSRAGRSGTFYSPISTIHVR